MKRTVAQTAHCSPGSGVLSQANVGAYGAAVSLASLVQEAASPRGRPEQS